MATFKYGSNSLLTLTSRITTPSIHIQKDGNHWYVPLFSGNKGSVVKSGDYNYTLGGLKVGSYRAAIGREEVINIYVFSSSNTTWILTPKGEIYGCGHNNYGQQGSGDSGDTTERVLTFTKRASNVKDVICSDRTTWYIDNNNNLYGCGHNYFGQQGSGDTTDVLTFTKRASNVKDVICSNYTTWYIDNNNNLYGCGYNSTGQQGSGGTTNVLTFTKRASNVKDVICTNYTTWYIDNNNNLYGCGDNYYGQQGSGDSGYGNYVSTFTKRASNVKEFSCSEYTTWYINNNNLYGCGSNSTGQQGSGDSGYGNYVSTFTKRASNVKEVSCAGNTTWYIDNNNNLYGCGYNSLGQQGSGDTSNVLVFTKREL